MSNKQESKRPAVKRPPAKPDAVTPEIKAAVAKAMGLARECGATRKAIIESLERIQYTQNDSDWKAREQLHAKAMAGHMECTAADLIHAAKRIKGLATALQIKLDSNGRKILEQDKPPVNGNCQWEFVKSGYHCHLVNRNAWITKEGNRFRAICVDAFNGLCTKEFESQLDCFAYAERFLNREINVD